MSMLFDTGFPEKLATFQGFKPWNTQLRDAVYRLMQGKFLQQNWHGNIKFRPIWHKASIMRFTNMVGLFVPLTGWLLVAQQFPDKRIFVLDCDQHGGNGTAEFTRRFDNFF